MASMVSLITGIFAPHTNISSLAVRILKVPPVAPFHGGTPGRTRLGYAVMHRGRHRHGAEDITAGERMLLGWE